MISSLPSSCLHPLQHQQIYLQHRFSAQLLQGTYGTIVAPGVNAQNHQHMFIARLDFAVDDDEGGRALIVTEVGAGLWLCHQEWRVW